VTAKMCWVVGGVGVGLSKTASAAAAAAASWGAAAVLEPSPQSLPHPN